jgi:hypothetical protein
VCAPAHAQQNAARQPRDFFSHPESLCSALEDTGIHAGPWRQIGLGFFSPPPGHSVPGPYFCEYPQWVAHSLTGAPSLARAQTVRSPGPDTSLVYRVSGDSEKRADIISIAVTVHVPAAMDIGEQELERQIIQLFKTIDHHEPPGLFQSIKRRQYFLSRQPYGIVWFNLVLRDHHNVDDQTLWFRLYE